MKTTHATLAVFLALAATTTPADAANAAPLLVCNKGPSGQRFHVTVAMPGQVDAGEIYTVRIDGADSGTVTHFGLNYIHDMTVDYALPAGAYVPNSARFVPGTGTPNVVQGASLSVGADALKVTLSGKVKDGTSYTPPSVEFQLRAVRPSGSSAALSFRRFTLKANAIVVGDVDVTCASTPSPYPIATTLIAPPPRAALP
jgi:hypothetical protein